MNAKSLLRKTWLVLLTYRRYIRLMHILQLLNNRNSVFLYNGKVLKSCRPDYINQRKMFWFNLLILCGYVSLGLAIFCTWSRWYFNYWRRKGVPGPRPEIFFGNIKESLLLRKNVNFDFQHLYNQHKTLPYTGIYILYKKTLCVHNLDLIKDIFVRDFSYFTDRSYMIQNEKNDPLGMQLANLMGNEWKVMRHRLTPTFSTAKMKFMFDTMVQCNGDMLAYLDSEVATHGAVDVKELFAKLNTDVIGSCAFGIECNTFKDPNQKFREVGMNFLYPSAFRTFVRAFCLIFPNLSRLLNISFIEKDVHDFMFGLVKSTIKYREDNQVRRNDFLQILLDLKDGDSTVSGTSAISSDSGPRLTTMQIAAQVFVFFVAGFESSSTTQSFALYELALNPTIQAAVRAEVDEVLSHHRKFTYEALQSMSYLTKVIEETLRKYPPLSVIFRTCTKDYSLPGDIRLEKGTAVMVPVLAIQRDPDYFPDPDKFDPERFSPENKAARHHFAYLPFGEGPRICIGARFAMLQTRLGLASLLSKFEVSACEKTSIPVDYDTKSFVLTSAGGVWLKLTKRNNLNGIQNL